MPKREKPFHEKVHDFIKRQSKTLRHDDPRRTHYQSLLNVRAYRAWDLIRMHEHLQEIIQRQQDTTGCCGFFSRSRAQRNGALATQIAVRFSQDPAWEVIRDFINQESRRVQRSPSSPHYRLYQDLSTKPIYTLEDIQRLRVDINFRFTSWMFEGISPHSPPMMHLNQVRAFLQQEFSPLAPAQVEQTLATPTLT